MEQIFFSLELKNWKRFEGIKKIIDPTVFFSKAIEKK